MLAAWNVQVQHIFQKRKTMKYVDYFDNENFILMIFFTYDNSIGNIFFGKKKEINIYNTKIDWYNKKWKFERKIVQKL